MSPADKLKMRAELSLAPPSGSSKQKSYVDENVIEDASFSSDEYELFLEKEDDTSLDDQIESEENLSPDLPVKIKTAEDVKEEISKESLSFKESDFVSEEVPQPAKLKASKTIAKPRAPHAVRPVDSTDTVFGYKRKIDAAAKELIKSERAAKVTQISDPNASGQRSWIGGKVSAVGALATSPVVVSSDPDNERQAEKGSFSVKNFMYGLMDLLKDIATTAISFFFFYILVMRPELLVLTAVFFVIGIILRAKSPKKLIAFGKRTYKRLAYPFKPLFDQRLFLFLTFLSLGSVSIIGKYLPHLNSLEIKLQIASVGAGISIFLSCSFLRLFKAGFFGYRVVDGKFEKPIPKLVKYSVDWNKTEGLDSKELKAFNDKFETYVSELFSELGFDVDVIGTQNAKKYGHKGPGDGGIDIIVKDSDKSTLLISCKRYADPIGVKPVREIFGVAQSERFPNARAALVTTVGFTPQAIQFAEENSIILIKYSELLRSAKKFMI